MALDDTIIAGINFLAVLLSVPVIGIGIWLAMQTDNSCVQLLQWPVIVIGIVILLVALAGFVGAFWRMPRLLLFYLVAMLVVILLLASLVIFIYAVTVNGSGHPAPNRAYLEYRLEDYSGWLRRRVEGSYKWNRIKKCLSSTTVCAELNQTYRLAEDFFGARMSPLQVSVSHRCIFYFHCLIYRSMSPSMFIAAAVRMLQATDGMRVHVRESDVLDQPHQHHIGRGLHAVEQRPDGALLLVHVLQSRLAGQP